MGHPSRPHRLPPDPGQVRLTDVLRTPVVTAEGAPLGPVRDVCVRLDSANPVVVHVLVDSAPTLLLVPWQSVAALREENVTLRPQAPIDAEAGQGRDPVPVDELRLARDVLDSQVVDLAGHRLSRVSEVLLRLSNQRLEVTSVDLGVPALMHRLGLGALVRGRSSTTVDWADLHLTSSRGHQLQLATAAAAVHRLDSRGLAELLARVSTRHGTEVVRTVGPERSAAALRRSHPRVAGRLLRALEDVEADAVVSAVRPPHDAQLSRWRDAHGRTRRLRRTAGWQVHHPRAPSDDGT